TDGDTRQRRMAQRIGEKGHPVAHHCGSHQTKQGGNQQNCQQGVFHKVKLRPFKGKERINDSVQYVHHTPPRPKISCTSGEASTSSGVPRETMLLSSTAALVAYRRTWERSWETRMMGIWYSLRREVTRS